MMLNEKKSNSMTFNFCENFQFTTRIHMNNALMDTISETKLLGCFISSDLTWHKNTESITKRAYQRMTMLHKLYDFDVPVKDLLHIYKLFIRSVAEQNCVVWHFSITPEEISDIERIQKTACKIILKQGYTDYKSSLAVLELQSLEERRNKLCLTFAINSLKYDKSKDMFPRNNHIEKQLRNRETFQVQHANTQRLSDSTIPQLQRALNNHFKLKH